MLPGLAQKTSELSAAGDELSILGEASLKPDLVLHFSSLPFCQHQLGDVEFCFDLILFCGYTKFAKSWKGLVQLWNLQRKHTLV